MNPHDSRTGRQRWKTTALSALCAVFLGGVTLLSPLQAVSVQASEERIVNKPDGSPLFALHFFDLGERYEDYEDPDVPGYSPWQLSSAQKDAVARAAALWAEVLGPGSRNSAPIPITIGTYLVQNADASSEPNGDPDAWDAIFPTGVQDAIINGIAPDAPGLIHIGTLDFAIPGGLSSVPSVSGTDLVAVLYHELGHALGISSLAPVKDSQYLSTWDAHLRDQYGTWLRPGITIAKDGEGTPGTDFIAGDGAQSGVTFQGEHVAEVMGAGEGLPVNGYEDDDAELSHIELEHSLMSHQNYRNYTTFMEAELAALQDMGYALDRRNFFGFSVYGDDGTIINHNGYYARNAAGDAYLTGQGNTATLGVGLHIYGKRNDVTQAADLLADGAAGTGIRMDGSENTLRIAPGVRVSANGDGGTGLLVAYGKEQNIISRGDVEALGAGGVAARFDFGHNLLGDAAEYRGSWIWSVDGQRESIAGSGNLDYSDLPLNLDGALVSAFDVSGSLSGSAAAIYIAENALVSKINVLSGASINGDIISDWDPENPDIQYTGPSTDLHTALTFGLAPQADGSAGSSPDAAFAMTLNGGVYGAESIDMTLSAGRLSVTGPLAVYSLANSGHLSLGGMTVSGAAADVSTTFVNAPGATLETGVRADGSVAGVRADTATLAGDWRLRPLPDFYAGNAVITPDAPVQAATINGGFSSVSLVAGQSPTLDFRLSAASPDAPQLHVSRAADAYSRYAAGSGAASLGRALSGIAGAAQGDMQALLAAIDWSPRDGSGVRQALDQLGPEAYDASARASLGQQNEFTTLLLRRILAGERARQATQAASVRQDIPNADQWQVWATPYGAASWQGSHGGASGWSSAGAGLLAGMDRHFDPGLTLGFHLALAARRTTINGAHDATADTQSALAGLQGLLAPEQWDGLYLTAQARLGMEQGEMDRNVRIGETYLRHNESRWTGLTGSAMLGGGKDWSWRFESGSLSAGPLGWLEYAFLRRPGFSERDGQASRLRVDDSLYESLLLSLGAHAGWDVALENGSTLGLDVLAAWRHELLDGTFRTSAAFRGYGSQDFRSATELAGRDALLLQGSLRLHHTSNFFTQVEAGGEFFRTNAAAVNAGLSFGWEF